MSQHHRRVKHTTISTRMRPVIAAQLPAPCIQPRCQLGGVVYASQPWDVAHLIDLGLGGDANAVGPAHRRCNRSDGGRAGRAKQLAAKTTPTAERGVPRWF